MTATITTHARIETPENVWLNFRLAGPGLRLGAYFIDVAIRALAIVFVVFVLRVFSVLDGLAGLSSGILLVLLFAAEWLYGFFFEAFWSGRTPGKRAVGLRVMSSDGCPITPYDALLRNLLRAADVLPLFYAVGLLSAFASASFQRLGDRVAGTFVVQERSNTLRSDLRVLKRVPPFARGELRWAYRPDPATLQRIDSLLRRGSMLPRARTREIALILARPLAERMGFEGELRDPVDFLLRTLKTFSTATPARSTPTAPAAPHSAPQAELASLPAAAPKG